MHYIWSYLQLNKTKKKHDSNRELSKGEMYVSSEFCSRQAEGLNQAASSCVGQLKPLFVVLGILKYG